ncbi:CD225/dispanin family protein [Actinomadura rudentiformis]|uniref:CD225/dispanin family protein n=1 Tax=Actinomadura rudentiformis TaxID=359158 RepID=A0A6H9Y693_9ACTN|nr:CD225/dispanin family protein [Actinomadura rudentiformis]KAB2337987.1 CD225/dispanin family protein [Actinomadura rudentiformis]
MSYKTPGYGDYPSTPSGPPPPNHLVWAILTTLFCCLPAGIASIVFSTQVNSKWQAGDYAGAQKASNNAKTWAIVSAVAGLIFGLIYAVILVAASSNS